MNKASIIKNIRQAKPEHIEWIKQGNKLIQGLPQDEITKPVDCIDCHFSKWYAAEGHKLVNIPQLKTLQDIHQDIHKAYTAIYYITFDRRQKPRSTVITNEGEIPVDEKPFRQQKLKELQKKIVIMIRTLDEIEKKVEAMNEQDFNSGWFL